MDNRKARMLFLKRNKAYRISNRKWIAVLNRSGDTALTVLPETLPFPVMFQPGWRFGKGVRTQTMLDALQRRAEYYTELEAMTPEQRADHDAGVKGFAAMLNANHSVDANEKAKVEPVSNRDELPLGYLQGHKDGLEWAAQLAEANHPQTGDWLYDDPIALAAAIRKGPDMPELKSAFADEDDNFYSWFGRFWLENYQQNNYTTSAKQMLGTMAEFAFRAGRESATQADNSPVIQGGWVACSERMPERDYVLAADFSGAYYLPSLPNTQVGIYADWFEDGNPSWDEGDGNDLYLKQVTHWMPLPAAPQQEVRNGN